ncbi:hypothetical protein CLF_105903 [Clonorchis sinensis]|uniref:Uncharacterized protein n=1 Tax=Clonorchis sinensis TaxID=79923 RepID=G7YED9_CLOSI|nr:hypothetical protein CLF_105903 [Clonorchis sinensis]
MRDNRGCRRVLSDATPRLKLSVIQRIFDTSELLARHPFRTRKIEMLVVRIPDLQPHLRLMHAPLIPRLKFLRENFMILGVKQLVNELNDPNWTFGTNASKREEDENIFEKQHLYGSFWQLPIYPCTIWIDSKTRMSVTLDVIVYFTRFCCYNPLWRFKLRASNLPHVFWCNA